MHWSSGKFCRITSTRSNWPYAYIEATSSHLVAMPLVIPVGRALTSSQLGTLGGSLALRGQFREI